MEQGRVSGKKKIELYDGAAGDLASTVLKYFEILSIRNLMKTEDSCLVDIFQVFIFKPHNYLLVTSLIDHSNFCTYGSVCFFLH